MAEARSPRHGVFVSYAHKDPAEYLETLLTHLAPLKAKGVAIWTDKEIEPGALWRDKIKAALATAKVGVLVVTPNFLASDFVVSDELPKLLDAAENDGMTILWLPFEPSGYKQTRIERYQAAHSPDQPLAGLRGTKRAEAFVNIASKIARAHEKGSEPVPAATNCVAEKRPPVVGTPKREDAVIPQKIAYGEPSQGESFSTASAPAIGAEQMHQADVLADDDLDFDTMTALRSHSAIEITFDTPRLRRAVHGVTGQARLVDELVRAGADSNRIDTQIRRTLFQLLVPPQIEPFMSGSAALVLTLDADTARLPWELIDSGGENLPWAVRTKVLRTLRADKFREQPAGARRADGVLVIGEPACDKTRFAELPGARQEAQEVAKALGVEPLIAPDALQVVNALLAQPLRIVHLSGHGEYRADGSGGVVLSNYTVLGPAEIAAMRSVPELVFVNCCFIGQIHPDSAVQRNALGDRRTVFAASVAEQLIGIGVRCVVAAGWVVEDGPATQFALGFYQRLLAGDRFIDAVGAARLAAWEAHPAGNTWAAYQCYGDPSWRYWTPIE